MRLWHYVSQAILAQEPLTTSLSATTTTQSISSTQSISPSAISPSNPSDLIMATSDGTNNTTNTTLYFGYGSNLWRQQMHQRCPNSTYLGIARLKNFKWIINERGYANVVEIKPMTKLRRNAVDLGVPEAWQWTGKYESQVWGLVYSLQPSDEQRLDRNEGVPVAYTKEMLRCDFWPASENQVDGSSEPAKMYWSKLKKKGLLVYINRDAVTPSKPKEEYVYRMNMGIKDAIKEGVPQGYVEEVMRKFIPEMEGEGEVMEVAKKQAAEFEVER
jgi:gamma-glutamylcyclotransferase